MMHSTNRMLFIILKGLSTTSHVSIRFHCSPFSTNTPFFPFIEQLRSSAGFIENDSEDDKLDKLERLIGENSGNADTNAPLLAALMSLPVDRYAPLEFSPAQQKMETITVLVDHLVNFSRKSSVIVLF